MARKMKLDRLVLNSSGIQNFLASEEIRVVLKDPAQEIYNSILPSDGEPGGKRQKGVKQVNGRYREKFIDHEARGFGDKRAAVHVGVRDADAGFFRKKTLQKALRAVGGKMKRTKKK